jgi:hypothetical protein
VTTRRIRAHQALKALEAAKSFGPVGQMEQARIKPARIAYRLQPTGGRAQPIGGDLISSGRGTRRGLADERRRLPPALGPCSAALHGRFPSRTASAAVERGRALIDEHDAGVQVGPHSVAV